MSATALTPTLKKAGFRFFSLTELGRIEPGVPSFKQHNGTLVIKPRGKRNRQFKIFVHPEIDAPNAIVNKNGTFFIQSGIIQEFSEDNVIQIRDASSCSYDKVAVYLPVNLGRKLLIEETRGYINELAHSFLVLQENTSFIIRLDKSFYKVSYQNKELVSSFIPLVD